MVEEKKETKELPPTFLPPVRAIDFARRTGGRIGGITIRGQVAGGGGAIPRGQLKALRRRIAARQQREETALRKDLTGKLQTSARDLIQQTRQKFQDSIRTFKSRNERLQAERELNQIISLITQQERAKVRGLQTSSLKELQKPKKDIFKIILPGFRLGVGGITIGARTFGGIGKTIPISDITQLAFDKAAERGFTKERIANLIIRKPEDIDKLKFLNEEQKSSLKKLQSFSRGAIIGSLKSVEKRPEKIITITAASFIAPEFFAAFRGFTIAKKILNRIPASIKKKGAKAIQTALGGLYLATTGLEILKQPTPEKKGEVVGKLLTTEIAPFIIGTRLGIKGLLKNEVKAELETELNKLSPGKREAFDDYIKQAELLSRFEPQAKNIKLNNIKSIPNKKAQDEIRKFLKTNKDEVVVGGSTAQTGQLDVRRPLGDMDLYLEGRLNPNQAARLLANQLKNKGIGRVSSIRGQVTIDGKKAIEFHDINRLLTNIEQVTPSWQNPRRYIIKTPEGIKIQRVGLQLRRKAVAGFADPRRLATGKYRQDLKDFKSIADKLFQRAELRARGSFFFRETKIKKLEKIFGKTISRKPVEVPSLFKKPKEVFTKPFKKPPVPREVRRLPIEPKKPRFKKLSERESEIIRRSKIISSQKPFSQLGVKPKVIPSQVPFRPKRLPSQVPFKRKEPPSQPPFKREEEIFIPPPTLKGEPSQPPSQPPLRPPSPPFVPPPRRPQENGDPGGPPPSKIPFKSQTLKRKPFKKVFPGVEGYVAFVREAKGRIKTIKGRKIQQPRRLLRINKIPTTKQRARDAMALLIDNTLASFGKIQRVPGKAKPLRLNIPKGYFIRTQNKYRNFRIRKGKRIPLRNAWIEKRGKPRLDTLGEKRKIKAFALLSRLRKQKRSTFPKLKSTRLIKFNKKRK